MPGSVDPVADWRSSARVTPAEDLRTEIARRREVAVPARSVSVSDLLDVRSAYYQRVSPVPMTPERRLRVEAGREAHLTVGSILAAAAHLEVRVKRDGIIGQIDLYDSRPTEIKTTASLPADGQIRDTRPQYIEQVAMYCALADRSAGRLLLVQTASGEFEDVAVYDLRFDDLEGIRREMIERAELLRSAWESRSPRRLPACEWRGRGCPYEVARACECDGSEVLPLRSLGQFARELHYNGGETDRVRGVLRQAPRTPQVVRRFRDLLYPRRTFFERTRPKLGESTSTWHPDPARDDLYHEITELLESGPPGEATRESGAAGVPPESVACFRGAPYLLKMTRSWARPTGAELLVSQPQYFLELGFRCASLGRPEGWLFIGYERADQWPDRLAAFRVTFAPLSTVAGIAARLVQDLEAAVSRNDPSGLPPCPVWMYERCDYREVCACGVVSGDSTRP